jgi:hypothetical protein
MLMRLLALPLLLTLAGCPLLPFDDPGCRLGGSCDDGNPCTDDSCNMDTGACEFAPLTDGSDCADDDDVCNGRETCASGTCVMGTPIDTTDLDPCTSDSCDQTTGAVSHEPIANCMQPGWQLLPTDNAPAARRLHAAVWTGSEMIIWGGRVDDMPNVTATGARYDPNTDTWTPTSMSGAPPPRHSHSAVWTGTHMLVWGGFGATGYETGGGMYNPQDDSWTTISSNGAPQGRTFHATEWIGDEMIVWGGLNQSTSLNDGARYSPSSDSWQLMASSGAPSPRFKHMSAWTGAELIFWGGADTIDWLDNGAYYDPGSNTWTGLIETTRAPFVREAATGLWIGDAMLIWGGWDGGNYLDTGALLDPSAGGGTWSTMTLTDAPAKRAEHISVWTGRDLFVWAGCAGMACNAFLADGGRWTPGPDGGTWAPVLADATFPQRVEHRAVWTGSEVIVFGGRNDDGIRGDGARATLDSLLAP